MSQQAAPAASKPIRIFTLPDSGMEKAPIAIGRRHASWFLCFPGPYGLGRHRTWRCLNVVHGSETFLSDSADGHPRIVLNDGGRFGNENLLQDLLRMRDDNGRAPIKLTAERVGGLPVVEVLVPRTELIYACAHCGKWETRGAPRFKRCSGCCARLYCSQKCQKADWTPALHKADCFLLKIGEDHAVEQRRRLHDNDWGLHDLIRTMELGPSADTSYDEDLDSDEIYFFGKRACTRELHCH
ncbi:hypothetical protein BKA93DRAFT_824092 [Sparassis latifolia]